jgi:hypothetical protein
MGMHITVTRLLGADAERCSVSTFRGSDVMGALYDTNPRVMAFCHHVGFGFHAVTPVPGNLPLNP